MNLHKTALISMTLSIFLSASAFGGSYFDKLSSTQQEQVLSGGKQLESLREVSGKPWPEITLSQWTSASPEQVCGVFADFGQHKKYMGDMLKSEATKISKNVIDVEYEISVPVVSNEVYTVRNTITAYDSKSSYKISWELLKATRTEASAGFFACEPVSGGTFIAYQNFVAPGLSNFIARQIFSKALAKVKATPYSVLKQLKNEASTNPALLERQSAALRAAAL